MVTDDPQGLFFLGSPSTVDGATLMSLGYIPPGAGNALRPLVIVLHGKGETPRLYAGMQQELDARGWSALIPVRPPLGRFPQALQRGELLVLHRPPLRPGLRAVRARRARRASTTSVCCFPVDGQRVYLCGFSAGGMGAYAIGLKRPDLLRRDRTDGRADGLVRVRAAGRLGGQVRGPRPATASLGIVGGAPQRDPVVHTLYKLTSARFLIENARNLPVFHAHGRADGAASEPARRRVLAARGPRPRPTTVGPAVTRATGRAATPAPGRTRASSGPCAVACLFRAHSDAWPSSRRPTRAGTHGARSSPATATRRRSAGCAARSAAAPTRRASPARSTAACSACSSSSRGTRASRRRTEVVFKTYTSEHRRAYWLELDTQAPWSGRPAAVRARRGGTSRPEPPRRRAGPRPAPDDRRAARRREPGRGPAVVRAPLAPGRPRLR